MIGLCNLEVTKECEWYPCKGCAVVQRFGGKVNLFEKTINSMKPGIICPECKEQCQRVQMDTDLYYDQCKCGQIYGQERIEKMNVEGQEVIESMEEPEFGSKEWFDRIEEIPFWQH